MLRRWTRFVLTAALGLALWLACGDARASAPMCDHRGASANAPPPTLDTPQTSVEIDAVPGPAATECDSGMDAAAAPDDSSSLHRDAPRLIIDSDMPACALPPALPFALPSASLLDPITTTDGPRAGQIFALERPPRSSSRV
jgi:hypothetical protein